MAIVDGKRIPGVTFYKVKGKRSWVAHVTSAVLDVYTTNQMVGLVVDYSGDNPIEERFHYCSPVSQPVFLDVTSYVGWPDPKVYTPSSWKKMPEGWREIFRRDYFELK